MEAAAAAEAQFMPWRKMCGDQLILLAIVPCFSTKVGLPSVYCKTCQLHVFSTAHTTSVLEK